MQLVSIALFALLCSVLYNLDAFNVFACQVQVKQLMPPVAHIAMINNANGQSLSVCV
jgi:hypothetical protein